MKLKAFDSFYADIQRRAQTEEDTRQLLKELKKHGKWPAKPDLLAWFGEKRQPLAEPEDRNVSKSRHTAGRFRTANAP